MGRAGVLPLRRPVEPVRPGETLTGTEFGLPTSRAAKTSPHTAQARPPRGVEGSEDRSALAKAGTGAPLPPTTPQPSHSPRILRSQQLQAGLCGQASAYAPSPAHPPHPTPPLVSAENNCLLLGLEGRRFHASSLALM